MYGLASALKVRLIEMSLRFDSFWKVRSSPRSWLAKVPVRMGRSSRQEDIVSVFFLGLGRWLFEGLVRECFPGSGVVGVLRRSGGCGKDEGV